MKIFTYILIIAALGLIIFNSSKLDMDAPFDGESAVAAIGIIAAACAVLLMVILRMSIKIKQKKR